MELNFNWEPEEKKKEDIDLIHIGPYVIHFGFVGETGSTETFPIGCIDKIEYDGVIVDISPLNKDNHLDTFEHCFPNLVPSRFSSKSPYLTLVETNFSKTMRRLIILYKTKVVFTSEEYQTTSLYILRTPTLLGDEYFLFRFLGRKDESEAYVVFIIGYHGKMKISKKNFAPPQTNDEAFVLSCKGVCEEYPIPNNISSIIENNWNLDSHMITNSTLNELKIDFTYSGYLYQYFKNLQKERLFYNGEIVHEEINNNMFGKQSMYKKLFLDSNILVLYSSRKVFYKNILINSIPYELSDNNNNNNNKLKKYLSLTNDSKEDSDLSKLTYSLIHFLQRRNEIRTLKFKISNNDNKNNNKIKFPFFGILERLILGNHWTPQTHNLYCSKFKDFIVHLFLCFFSNSSSKSSLGRISKDNFQYNIIPYISELEIYLSSGYNPQILKLLKYYNLETKYLDSIEEKFKNKKEKNKEKEEEGEGEEDEEKEKKEKNKNKNKLKNEFIILVEKIKKLINENKNSEKNKNKIKKYTEVMVVMKSLKYKLSEIYEFLISIRPFMLEENSEFLENTKILEEFINLFKDSGVLNLLFLMVKDLQVYLETEFNNNNIKNFEFYKLLFHNLIRDSLRIYFTLVFDFERFLVSADQYFIIFSSSKNKKNENENEKNKKNDFLNNNKNREKIFSFDSELIIILYKLDLLKIKFYSEKINKNNNTKNKNKNKNKISFVVDLGVLSYSNYLKEILQFLEEISFNEIENMILKIFQDNNNNNDLLISIFRYILFLKEEMMKPLIEEKNENKNNKLNLKNSNTEITFFIKRPMKRPSFVNKNNMRFNLKEDEFFKDRDIKSMSGILVSLTSILERIMIYFFQNKNKNKNNLVLFWVLDELIKCLGENFYDVCFEPDGRRKIKNLNIFNQIKNILIFILNNPDNQNIQKNKENKEEIYDFLINYLMDYKNYISYLSHPKLPKFNFLKSELLLNSSSIFSSSQNNNNNNNEEEEDDIVLELFYLKKYFSNLSFLVKFSDDGLNFYHSQTLNGLSMNNTNDPGIKNARNFEKKRVLIQENKIRRKLLVSKEFNNKLIGSLLEIYQRRIKLKLKIKNIDYFYISIVNQVLQVLRKTLNLYILAKTDYFYVFFSDYMDIKDPENQKKLEFLQLGLIKDIFTPKNLRILCHFINQEDEEEDINKNNNNSIMTNSLSDIFSLFLYFCREVEDKNKGDEEYMEILNTQILRKIVMERDILFPFFEILEVKGVYFEYIKKKIIEFNNNNSKKEEEIEILNEMKKKFGFSDNNTKSDGYGSWFSFDLENNNNNNKEEEENMEEKKEDWEESMEEKEEVLIFLENEKKKEKKKAEEVKVEVDNVFNFGSFENPENPENNSAGGGFDFNFSFEDKNKGDYSKI